MVPLVNAYLGWAGGFALSVVDVAARPLAGVATKPDMRIEDYLVIGRFAREGRSSRFVTEFYEQKNAIDQHVADIKRYRDNQEFDKLKSSMEKYKDDVRYRKMYSRTGRQISNINKQIRLITSNKNMSGAVKRRKIDVLNARRSALAKRMVERFAA